MNTEIRGIINRVITRVIEDRVEDEITFFFEDGSEYKFYHRQDCCESVVITDVNGDWDDLIGTPLLVAEERTDSRTTSWGMSNTFTFYTFRTVKGSVDVRWNGQSNGYYSESVDHGFIVKGD